MTSNRKLLIVDDDPDILYLLRQHLTVRGYDVHTAQSGEESLLAFVRVRPDLVILDIMMPDMDGRSVCRWLRERSQVPIIFLTALDGVPNLIGALALGADQYITKPFALVELEARLSALLRRASVNDGGRQSVASEDGEFPSAVRRLPSLHAGPDYDDGHLVIDLGRRSVSLDGRPVLLTATEFKILACLTQRAGSVVPHHELLTQVWGPEYIGDVAFLKTYIHHLRRKLRCEHGNYPYILNKWGVGYRLRAQNERENSEQWDASLVGSGQWVPVAELAASH